MSRLFGDEWEIEGKRGRITYLTDGYHTMQLIATGRRFEVAPDGWDGDRIIVEHASEIPDALSAAVDMVDGIADVLRDVYCDDTSVTYPLRHPELDMDYYL